MKENNYNNSNNNKNNDDIINANNNISINVNSNGNSNNSKNNGRGNDNLQEYNNSQELFYKSTRGSVDHVSSSQAIISGIAKDGGLYVPSSFPSINFLTLNKLLELNYKELAKFILSAFLSDYANDEINFCVEKAYDEKFDTPEIAPLKKVGDVFFLELFHGATAAFKDMALSILPYLLIKATNKTSLKKEIVILTATSGDTGKAALESFSNVEGTKIIVFYPNNGVSLIQERQMITQEGNNTFVCAIEGNFDDAQTGVKEIFNDSQLNKLLEEKNYIFSSANSINIGRLLPQVVYYIYAYLKLVSCKEIEIGQEINILVPTGNFGNILAAYYAKKMGLPVQRLICASNENNVLYDFINTGIYDKRRELKLTISPSMDILVSSNLERLIYDISDCNSEYLKNLYNDLNSKGYFKINEEMKEKMASFWAGFATEEQTLNAINKAYYDYNYLIDTHTGVGFHVYNEYKEMTNDKVKTVITSTASPFKFPASVLKAIDKNFDKYKKLNEIDMLQKLSNFTGIEIPKALKGIDTKKILHNNKCEVSEMKDFVKKVLNI